MLTKFSLRIPIELDSKLVGNNKKISFSYLTVIKAGLDCISCHDPIDVESELLKYGEQKSSLTRSLSIPEKINSNIRNMAGDGKFCDMYLKIIILGLKCKRIHKEPQVLIPKGLTDSNTYADAVKVLSDPELNVIINKLSMERMRRSKERNRIVI